MYYIQFKCRSYPLETVDEFESLSEAKKMLTEYKMVSSSYYLSTRKCKNWRE